MPKNIVLIGMMGCGKTTVGRLLSQRFQRPLVDTDALIEERQGRSIPDIFAADGEAHFRTLELELCRELGKKEGLIISCGGGLPLQCEAIAALKQSSLVFWLDRDPGETYDSLDVSGRPLAQAGREDFIRRYTLRAPIYSRSSDYLVRNPESPEYADRLIAAIYLEVTQS